MRIPEEYSRPAPERLPAAPAPPVLAVELRRRAGHPARALPLRSCGEFRPRAGLPARARVALCRGVRPRGRFRPWAASLYRSAVQPADSARPAPAAAKRPTEISAAIRRAAARRPGISPTPRRAAPPPEKRASPLPEKLSPAEPTLVPWALSRRD